MIALYCGAADLLAIFIPGPRKLDALVGVPYGEYKQKVSILLPKRPGKLVTCQPSRVRVLRGQRGSPGRRRTRRQAEGSRDLC